MRWISFLFLTFLVLGGASCGFQQPSPEDNTNQQQNEETDTMPSGGDTMEAEPASDEGSEDTEADTEQEGAGDESDNMDEELNEVSLPDELADDEIMAFFATEERTDDSARKLSCGTYLQAKMIELGEDKTQSDLAAAIVQLLTVRDDAHEEEGLTNPVWAHGILLANITYEDDGTRLIEFEGEPEFSDECKAQTAKAQLEETIQLYSDNYRITMNGEEAAWDEAFEVE